MFGLLGYFTPSARGPSWAICGRKTPARPREVVTVRGVRGAAAGARLSSGKGQTVIREHDSLVLAADLPEHGLERGDIGTVALVHRGGAGYEVEFMTLGGETVAVVSLQASQVRAIAPGEIAHARPLQTA